MSYINNPPRWCPDAIPTRAGWKHPTRKEILVSVKLSQEFIDSYNSVSQNIQSTETVNNEKQEEVKAPKQQRKQKK